MDRSWRLFVFKNVVFTHLLVKPIDFDEISLSRGSQNEPRGTQERPKSLSRASFFALRFWLRILIDFGPILAPKMGPRGPLWATKIESKNDQKSILKKNRLQNVLRWPKSSPGTPREAPGAPQELPGEAPGGSRRLYHDTRRVSSIPKNVGDDINDVFSRALKCEVHARCCHAMLFL